MTAAIVLAVVLVLLGIVVLSLWREVSLLEARVRKSGVQAVDGPEVGTLVPSAIRSPDAVYLFVSEDCPACHEVVSDLKNVELMQPFVARAVLVRDRDGTDAPSSPEVFSKLPAHIAPLSADLGDQVVSAFAIRATPLAIAVRNGLIVSKGYLRGSADLLEIARPLVPAASQAVKGARA
jgi:hypothetical protein